MPIVRRKKYKSLDIKCALMHYFRYKRNILCIDELTMFGNYKADIVADNERNIVYEVEIKVDINDLRNELKKKKEKHKAYKTGYGSIGIPNMFYFCVPKNMLSKAYDVIKKLNPCYGLMQYDCFNEDQLYQDRIFVVQQAKRINNEYKSIKDNIYIKASWDIMRKFDLKIKLENIKQQLKS